MRTGLCPCRKSQNLRQCSLTSAFEKETLGNNSLSISKARPAALISNMILLRCRQQAGVYFMHNSNCRPAVICIWSKYSKSPPFFSPFRNTAGSVLANVFYQESGAFFFFGSHLRVPKSSPLFPTKIKIALPLPVIGLGDSSSS